jgi:dihydroorotate dehydrogenase
MSGVVDRRRAGAADPWSEAELLDRLVVALQRHVRHLTGDARQSPALALINEARSRAGRLSDREQHELVMRIRRFCHVEDLPEVLSLSGVPVVYNFQAPFKTNVAGPWDPPPLGDGVTPGRRWTLLGRDVGYPIGIPASSLTVNAKYIDYFARQGFNILTYKTVRSHAWSAYEFPNWIYLEDVDRPLKVDGSYSETPVIGHTKSFPRDFRAYSTANSFGVPSEHPDVWTQDLEAAVTRLGAGKLLLVSAMGSSELEEFQHPDRLAEDFALVATLAEAAGASAIELNLSCPNTLDPGAGRIKDPVCVNPELTERIVRRVAERIKPDTPLVAKLSWMPKDRLERVLDAIVDQVYAVSGINTLQAIVVDEHGTPIFPGRDRAGISGVAIRDYGLDFVRCLAELKRKHAWEFEVIGMGGVMNSADVRAYLRAGANAVQTATAAEDNPTLPAELLDEIDESLSLAARTLLAVLEDQAGADLPQLASSARVSPSVARGALAELAERGMIRTVGTNSYRLEYHVDSDALERQLA